MRDILQELRAKAKAAQALGADHAQEAWGGMGLDIED